MHLAPVQLHIMADTDPGLVSGHVMLQNAQGGVLRPPVRPSRALLYGDIVLICQVPRQIGSGEGLEFIVVKGFDGVHVGIRHLGGGVHGDALEGDTARPLGQEVVGLGDLIVPVGILPADGALKVRLGFGLTVEHPEGDVDSLDLADLVAAGKCLWQKPLPLVMVLQGLLGGLLVQLEGQDVVRLQGAGKLPGHHGGVAAVGTGGGCRGLIADELCPAGGAAVSLHLGAVLSPVAVELGVVPGGIRLPCFFPCLLFLRGSVGLLGLLLLLRIHGLDLGYVKFAAAVVALQLAGGPHKVERTGTGRALVVGNLCWHRSAPLSHWIYPLSALPQYSQQPLGSGVVVAPHHGQVTAALGAAAAAASSRTCCRTCVKASLISWPISL